MPPDALIIELTEHALIDLRVAQPVLEQLRAAGVRISLDDFGTGYSSLTQLRSLPVDQMKLDRSFAAALDDGNDKQGAVVRSVVSLANALALDLVVEGVETVAEHDAWWRWAPARVRASSMPGRWSSPPPRSSAIWGQVCCSPHIVLA